MRKRPRLDVNHRAIAEALTAIGCSVVSLAGNGDGIPDLLVGYVTRSGPRAVLAELKTEKGSFTQDQERFACSWVGPYTIWRSPEEAVSWVLQATQA